MHFHDLRHTSASLALSAGVNPEVVEEGLKNSYLRLTRDRYSHVLPALQEKSTVQMEEIIGIPYVVLTG